jgi:hypothetical protein
MTVVSDAARSNGDVMRRLVELEAQVREMRAARRLEAATIGAGGLTIKDGGELVVRGGVVRHQTESGQDRMYFGPLVYGPPWDPGVGFIFRRNGGGILMSLEGADPDNQFWAVRDEDGSIIFSDDAATGKGMATPWLAHPMMPSFNIDTVAQLPGTPGSTFAGVLEARVPLSHPRLRMMALVGGSDLATVAGQGRWTVDGTTVGSTVTFPAGGFAWIDEVVDVPGWSDRAYLEEATIQIQTRKTAGTPGQRAVAACYALYCRQS